MLALTYFGVSKRAWLLESRLVVDEVVSIAVKRSHDSFYDVAFCRVSVKPPYQMLTTYPSQPSQPSTLYLLRVFLVLQPPSYSTCHHATQKARLCHLYCAEKARSSRSSFWLRQPAHRRQYTAICFYLRRPIPHLLKPCSTHRMPPPSSHNSAIFVLKLRLPRLQRAARRRL